MISPFYDPLVLLCFLEAIVLLDLFNAIASRQLRSGGKERLGILAWQRSFFFWIAAFASTFFVCAVLPRDGLIFYALLPPTIDFALLVFLACGIILTVTSISRLRRFAPASRLRSFWMHASLILIGPFTLLLIFDAAFAVAATPTYWVGCRTWNIDIPPLGPPLEMHVGDTYRQQGCSLNTYCGGYENGPPAGILTREQVGFPIAAFFYGYTKTRAIARGQTTITLDYGGGRGIGVWGSRINLVGVHSASPLPDEELQCTIPIIVR